MLGKHINLHTERLIPYGAGLFFLFIFYIIGLSSVQWVIEFFSADFALGYNLMARATQTNTESYTERVHTFNLTKWKLLQKVQYKRRRRVIHHTNIDKIKLMNAETRYLQDHFPQRFRNKFFLIIIYFNKQSNNFTPQLYVGN